MDLTGKKISILGFGNQAKAWALNMRDSGLKVRVALRTGSKSLRAVNESDLEVINIKQAFLSSDIICVLSPDETHPEIFKKYGDYLDDGQSIVFAHGYNVHFKLLKFNHNMDILLVAPKASGDAVRSSYLKDSGVPCLIAVDKDVTGFAWQTAKCIAQHLGCHRVGIYRSTFKEETEINLFTEQAFYLSTLPKAIEETYNTLIEAGYSKEASYWESLHKIKIFGDLISKKGLLETFKSVSSAARAGGILSSDQLIESKYKSETKNILKEIQNGTFTKRFNDELNSGSSKISNYLNKLKESPIETIGKRLREKVKTDE